VNVFEAMARDGHEQVTFFYDRATGLKLIVAVHDTTLGPAAGGCRYYAYASEEEALADALRLAKGMTFKNAASGLDFGGSKCVVIADRPKTPELLRAIGRFVEMMGGRIYTGEDVGLTPQDVAIMAETTRYIVGQEHASGDPSQAAAYGTYMAIRAVLEELFGDPSPSGRHIAIQGVGNVGLALGRHLRADGARLTVTDVDTARLERARAELGAEVVPPDAIYDVEADVLAPCALGGVLSAATVARLRVRAVAGSANNQLADDGVADLLAARGILYAPDFIVNGGGIINISDEFHPDGYNRERAYRKVARIYDRLRAIFAEARARGETPLATATRRAHEWLETAAQHRRYFVPRHGGAR
jgi:leucine dehydrogenase